MLINKFVENVGGKSFIENNKCSFYNVYKQYMYMYVYIKETAINILRNNTANAQCENHVLKYAANIVLILN